MFLFDPRRRGFVVTEATRPLVPAHRAEHSLVPAPFRSAGAVRRRPPRNGAIGQSLVTVLGLATVVFLSSGFGPNLALAVLAIAVFVIGSLALWRPGESPVLVMIFGLHWLGASIAIFHANWLGIEIFAYSEFGGEMQRAAMLSLVALLCLAIGMRLGAGAWREREAAAARATARSYSPASWFKLYCAACAGSFLALSLIWLVPSTAQLLIAVAALRWAFYFALAYASFSRGILAGPFLPIAFCCELAVSLGSYFSDFRTVFFFTIYAAFASGMRLTARMRAALVVLLAALLCLGVVWSGVKEEYRQFASEGRREQIITVDYATRLAKLVDLTSALDKTSLQMGLDKMLRRLSYIEYFSVVLDYVPGQVGHENGKLLADALERPFLPRAFFPEKRAIDDTERTNYYTGGLAGMSEGTSISIGYVAESYIDFGSTGMMAAIFGIGAVYGFAYRSLSRSKTAGSLLGMGLASAVLAAVGGLDSSITKVAGGLVASFLAAQLLARFVIPLAFQRGALNVDAR